MYKGNYSIIIKLTLLCILFSKEVSNKKINLVKHTLGVD